MPVHLAFDRHRGGTLDPAVILASSELDRLLDSKGCGGGRHSHQSAAVFRHLEPVCCCERCYAFLANPIIAKLTAAAAAAAAEDGTWGDEAAMVPQRDGDLTVEWFSLCPWTAACDCGVGGGVGGGGEKDVVRRMCGGDDGKDVLRSDAIVISDESPPLMKKRMTTEKSSTDGDSFVTGARRPLVDLQRGVVVSPRPPPPPSDAAALKRPDTFHPSAPPPRGFAWSRDETRSWVQPPPNRTICHIVDDVTLERLTAASSPVLTRCCVTSSSSSSARKQGTGRNVGGKTKAKNQCSVSR